MLLLKVGLIMLISMEPYNTTELQDWKNPGRFSKEESSEDLDLDEYDLDLDEYGTINNCIVTRKEVEFVASASWEKLVFCINNCIVTRKEVLLGRN